MKKHTNVMRARTNRLLCLTAACAATAVAQASIFAGLADLGGGLYELRVTTVADAGDPDDWTTARLTVTTTGTLRIFDPLVGQTPDDAFKFQGGAADTFFTRINGTAAFPTNFTFAAGPNTEPPAPGGPYSFLQADWFDVITVSTQGTDALARIMVIGDGTATLLGFVSGSNGDDLTTFSFTITPEPAGLGAFALLAGAGLRRRSDDVCARRN